MKQFLLLIRPLICTVVLCLFCASATYAQNAIVAADGSGNYTTVQAAINAAPTGSTSAYVIYIKNGTYNEVVSIPSTKPFIQLVGQSVEKTIITYNNGATTIVNGSALGTNNSATLTVGASDCALMNLTIQNTFGDPGVQAVAVLLNNDRIAVKNCRLMGNQDTLYTKGSGTPRHYFRNCYIDGTVDFMFGSSVDIFDSCVVYCKTRAVTGTPPSCTAVNTTAGQSYGYVYRNCILPANTLGTSYYLGRQWQNSTGFTPTSSPAQANNKVAFLNCTMGAQILPVGWSLWDSGTDTTKVSDAEYNSVNFDGTTTNVSSRVTWSQQLNSTQASAYTTANIYTVSAATWDPCPTVGCGVFTPDIAVSNFAVTKGTTLSTFNWNISWPISGVTYALYRSTDSVTFTLRSSFTSANDTNVNFSTTDSTPAQGNKYYFYVKATKSGYNIDSTSTLNVNSQPTIVSSGTIAAFTQYNGTPSGSASFTDSGVNLTAGIVITPPTNFQISTDNSNFLSSVTLSPTSGIIHLTTIYVRLNASVLGNYSGNITSATTGGTTVNMAVSGKDTTQPTYTESVLEEWPLTVSNSDSAAVRASGIVGTTPTFLNLALGTVSPAPYSPSLGELLYSGPTANQWGTGNAGNLSRIYYQQFTVTASPGYTMRVDSLIMNAAFYNTSSGATMAIVYSTSNFVSDSSNIYSYLFTTAGDIALTNITGTNNATKRLALVGGGSGVTIASGGTLTFRLYFTCSSSGNPRYAEVLNLIVKGVAPTVATTDYYSAATGNLDSTGTWGTNTDGTGTHPTDFVTIGQVFHLSNGNPGNISGATWTVSGTSSRIKLDNATDLTIAAGHAIAGKIAVSAGRTLTINNSTMPTLDTLASTATIVYGTPVTVPGTQTSFPNLQISAATTLSANTTVSGTLMMNGGKLNLNGNTLTIADISGASASGSITGSSTSGLIVSGNTTGFLYLDQTSTATATLGTLTLNGNVTLGTPLTVSGTLTINSGKVGLNGQLLSINNFSGGSASNSFTGSGASGLIVAGNLTGSLFFDQTTTATATLDTFAVNGNATLGNVLNIVSGATPGVVTVGTGATLTTGGNLYLLSDANGTSRIGALSGIISGVVNIQRFIPGQRGYRFLGHPYTANQDLTQLSASFDITGITGGSTCTGRNPSVFSYIPGAGSYTAVTNGTGAFPAAQSSGSAANGLLVFIRGAKGQDCTSSATTPPSNITFTTSGNVNQGDITETVPANGWSLISNPYPSPVLLSSVTNIGSLNAIVVAQPAQQNGSHTYTNGTAYFAASSSYVLPVNGAFLANNSTGSPISLVFHESSKSSSPPNTGILKTTNVYPTLELSVYNGSAFWDVWQMSLRPGATGNAGESGDLGKQMNTQFSISSQSSDNMALAWDARDAGSITDATVIPMGISSAIEATYTLQVSDYSLPGDKTVYLHDKYTNSYVLLSNGTSYPFTVNSDANSQGANRMELLFSVNNNTGVSNANNTQKPVHIIPNPATTNVILIYNDTFAGAKEISIMNALGQVVKTVTSSDVHLNVFIGDLPDGIYLVKTTAGGNVVTQRFIKN